MSDESASGSDPDLEPDVELEDAEEEEEEEEVAVEECGRDGAEDLLGGEWLQGVAGVPFSSLLWLWLAEVVFAVGLLRAPTVRGRDWGHCSNECLCSFSGNGPLFLSVSLTLEL